MRRLLEGKRVKNEIERKLKEGSKNGDASAALGTTMPRKSDKKKLRELDAKIRKN